MAMEIAQAPAKGLLMQGFMMYMTGSSVSIISIMIVGMCLMNSVKALAAVNQRKLLAYTCACAHVRHTHMHKAFKMRERQKYVPLT